MKSCRPLLGLVSLLFCCNAFAQSTNASLTGAVDDPSKAVIPGVSIAAINTETGVTAKCLTNGSGQYVLPALTPGSYRIEVDKIGFKGIIESGLVLHVQDVVQINFHMALGSSSETVTVSADGVNVNTTDAAVSTIIDRKFVDTMPLNGRSFQSLIALAPGVTAVPGATLNQTGEFSVNGQRANSNSYMVDGVSANTGMVNLGRSGNTPGETALGTTQSLASVDALQEFRINTSTYSAEYGRYPGAQISLQTRSGTNTWHGTMFEYFRNVVLDAHNWFNDASHLSRTPEKQNDFGGVLGGPVLIPHVYDGKDKTFFFFSYEGLRLQVPQAALTTDVPDTAMRQNAPAALRPILNAFPLQTGAEQGNGLALYTGSYSAPSSLDAYSIRLDHTFGPKLQIFGRYADTPSKSQTRFTPYDFANVVNTTGLTRSVTIGASSLFSMNLINDFRLNYTNNTNAKYYSLDPFGGAQPLTLAQAFPGIAVPTYYNFEAHLAFGTNPLFEMVDASDHQNQWNIVDSFSSTFRAHTLKYGIDYRRQQGTQGSNQLAVGFTYPSSAAVLANTSTYGYAQTYGTTPPIGTFTNFSAFAQDEWKVSNKLHASLGLRWDVNPPPTGNPQPYTLNQITNLATSALAPQGTPLYHTDYLGFAPRVGLAYQLRQTPGHMTVVRAGFGVFYDVGDTLALLGVFGGVGIGAFTEYVGAGFPLTPAQMAPPAGSTATPYNNLVEAPDPNLRLPYTLQYNASLQQQLGSNQSLTISYVASGGRKLLYDSNPVPANNPNFAKGVGPDLILNGASSSYNSLQVQFQRQVAHDLEAIASYTWSHSIDNLTSDANVYTYLLRGNSDYDVRHNFTGALSYEPTTHLEGISGAIVNHWGIDLRQTARSGLPVDIYAGYTYLTNGQMVYQRPNYISSVPLYLSVAGTPGGRVVNLSAFPTSPTGIGNEPRNFVRAFDAWQSDLAIRREFPIHDRLNLQFRAESFNIFNHPNFGTIQNMTTAGSLFGKASNTLNTSLGGLNSLYQTGGPRSLQLALRLSF